MRTLEKKTQVKIKVKIKVHHRALTDSTLMTESLTKQNQSIDLQDSLYDRDLHHGRVKYAAALLFNVWCSLKCYTYIKKLQLKVAGLFKCV